MKPIVKKFWKSVLPKSAWRKILSASTQLVDENDLAKKGFNSMWWSIENLKKLGFSPTTVVDVGAYKGEWTKHVRKIFNDSQFLMIEAQPERANDLKNIESNHNNVVFEQTLAGPADGEEKTFTVMKTGSSVFEQTYEGKADRKKITLVSNTLDSIVNKNELKGDFFLKMDVQGYELEVLKGAENILKETPVILLECSLLNYNQGAPLIGEIFEHFNKNDYVLFDICAFHRKSEDGVLNQVDLIFCKKDWEVREKVNFA